jgi:hypothetical protein
LAKSLKGKAIRLAIARHSKKSAARKRALEAEGKTKEPAEEALRKGLADRSWQELLGYGDERGQALGFREEQAADVVHAWRQK